MSTYSPGHSPCSFPIFRLAWVFGVIGAAFTCADADGLLPQTGWLRLLPNMTPVCLALAPLRAFAATGRMAFTNYIAQSVVFGLFFFGYGLGQFGSLPAAPVFAMGVAVYVAQVRISKSWLRHYRFGPIEWLWRTLMYGRRQAMRR